MGYDFILIKYLFIKEEEEWKWKAWYMVEIFVANMKTNAIDISEDSIAVNLII